MISGAESSQPLVSVITATYEREPFMLELVDVFRNQTYPNKELLIFDDSPEPLLALKDKIKIDDNIHYFYESNKSPVGTKLNFLIEKARGEFIVQFDNDDYYSPDYLSVMQSQMNDCDFLTLTAWYVLNLVDKTLGYCDFQNIKTDFLFSFSPQEKTGIIANTFTPEQLYAMTWGYGFSYCIRKTLWEQVKYQDYTWQDGRCYDYVFFEELMAKGFRAKGFPDQMGLMSHNIHGDNASKSFVNYMLPEFLISPILGCGVEPYLNIYE